jgi:dihydroorotate dehydrogenase
MVTRRAPPRENRGRRHAGAALYTSLALRGVGVVDDILKALAQMVAGRGVASISASSTLRKG